MSTHFVPATTSMISSSAFISVTAKRLAKPMLAMAALLALAGCSNGQNEANDTVSSDTNETAETTVAAADDSVLRIGTEGAYAPLTIPMPMAHWAALILKSPMLSVQICK